MHKFVPLFFSLALVSLLPVASAHHGFASHYDPNTVIRIEGTVKQFDFINPHGFLYIDSVDEAGEAVVFRCDLMAKTQLIRRGADESLFPIGDSIVVEGFPARREPNVCEFGTGYFADGSSFTMRSPESAKTQFAEIETPIVSADTDIPILGTWIRASLYDGSGTRPTGMDSITEAGEAAVAEFDPIADDPVVHCKGASPVRNWGAPGLATSIKQEGDTIIIHHESMDVTRTVHMNLTEHPADLPYSEMGHSIGRFEDDTLIIDTAAFDSGVIVRSALRTDQMTMVERLSVQPESGDLQISWVVHEPVYYSEPITGGQLLKRTDQEFGAYECNPE